MFPIIFSLKDDMLIPTNHWLTGRRPTSTSRRTSSSSSAPSTRTPPLTQRRSQEWVKWKLNLSLFLEGSIYEICRSRVFWPKPSWRVFAERKVVLCVRFSWGIKGIKLVLCCHTLHWESFLTFQCGWHFHTTFWISSNVRDSPHLSSDLRSVHLFCVSKICLAVVWKNNTNGLYMIDVSLNIRNLDPFTTLVST